MGGVRREGIQIGDCMMWATFRTLSTNNALETVTAHEVIEATGTTEKDAGEIAFGIDHPARVSGQLRAKMAQMH